MTGIVYAMTHKWTFGRSFLPLTFGHSFMWVDPQLLGD